MSNRARIAAGALAAATWAESPHATAAPPSADDFQVTYYLTDEDGNRDRKLTLQDMQQFWNRARCECKQKIRAEITMRAASAVDMVQIQTFVGPNCPQGQIGNTQQYLPCALLDTSFPMAFSTTRSFEFEPIWLAAGVAPGSPQSIDQAIPAGSCDTGQGAAGIWMCAENGQTAQCQEDEFFLTDTDNLNIPEGQTKAGIAYDFTAPVAPPTSFEIKTGDGAVEISWDLEATGDISGFRVLCAHEFGAPVEGKGIDPPSATAINLGNIYYTASQLCPDGPFGEETGGGTTGGSTTAGGATAGATGTGTGTGTRTAGGTGGDIGVFEDLDYAYVCTDHIAATSKEARVEGLQNGTTYQFLVVAYDKFGNPVPASPILTASPEATNDLWDECQEPQYGGICGERGFCHCRPGADDPPAGAFVWLLVALAARRRR